jgi:hypothetical protein
MPLLTFNFDLGFLLNLCHFLHLFLITISFGVRLFFICFLLLLFLLIPEIRYVDFRDDIVSSAIFLPFFRLWERRYWFLLLFRNRYLLLISRLLFGLV